jgi:hypothetical protein
VSAAYELSFFVLRSIFLGTLQFVRAPLLKISWSTNLLPPFCACRRCVFLLYFSFHIFIIFLKTLADIQQTGIVLLQCAVNVSVYLDFTNAMFSLVFVYLVAMTIMT